MSYIVKISCNGRVIETKEVTSMDQVTMIQACYEGTPYEVDFEPDAFRYLNLNRDARLS